MIFHEGANKLCDDFFMRINYVNDFSIIFFLSMWFVNSLTCRRQFLNIFEYILATWYILEKSYILAQIRSLNSCPKISTITFLKSYLSTLRMFVLAYFDSYSSKRLFQGSQAVFQKFILGGGSFYNDFVRGIFPNFYPILPCKHKTSRFVKLVLYFTIFYSIFE